MMHGGKLCLSVCAIELDIRYVYPNRERARCCIAAAIFVWRPVSAVSH